MTDYYINIVPIIFDADHKINVCVKTCKGFYKRVNFVVRNHNHVFLRADRTSAERARKGGR